MDPVERSTLYICGCKHVGPGEPDRLCPEHQVPFFTLTMRYNAGGRRNLRPGLPVVREGNLEDVMRDLEKQLGEERF